MIDSVENFFLLVPLQKKNIQLQKETFLTSILPDGMKKPQNIHPRSQPPVRVRSQQCRATSAGWRSHRSRGTQIPIPFVPKGSLEFYDMTS